MTLTIGVAIPCYNKHIHYIPELLENIASSTVKPHQIVISCSSWNVNKIEKIDVHGIPVTILYHQEVFNQARNRNIAGGYLTTDLISFFDADDIMHPKRIEFILDVFEKNPGVSAVYHNYVWCHSSERKHPFWEENEIHIISEPVIHDERGIGIKIGSYHIHHAQVTVKRNIFNVFKFNEDIMYYRIEDSYYATILKNFDVPIMYLSNQLSRYMYN